MLRSSDQMMVELLDAGEIYDSRRPGPARVFCLTRSAGRYVATWKNGPFDSHKVEVTHAGLLGAVRALSLILESRNVEDDQESAAG